MKAIVQEGSGSADVLQLREIDKPVVSEGRVLVRVRAASVNALDWHSVHGGRMIRLIGALLRQKSTPIRGVDVAGIVDEVGPNVTRLKPGDEVFGLASGTFAEYAVGKETGLVPKPVQLSFTQAATLGVAAVTALEALRKGEVNPGQRVLVHGAGGGVGTFAVQIAKALGAHVAAVTGTTNLDTVRTLGPDELIDYTKEDFTRRAQKYDVIVDVAATRSLADLKRVLTPNGRIVMTGAPKTGSMARMLVQVVSGLVQSRFDRRLVSFVARARQEDLVFLKELVEAGKLCPAIDREYPLSEAAEAVRYLGTGRARAKVVINVA